MLVGLEELKKMIKSVLLMIFLLVFHKFPVVPTFFNICYFIIDRSALLE